MDKLKQSFPLALVIWGATNLSQVSLAQYYVPMQPPVPRHDTMFPRHNRPNDIPSYGNTSNGSDPAQLSTSSTNNVCQNIIKSLEDARNRGASQVSIYSPVGNMKGSPNDLITFYSKRC